MCGWCVNDRTLVEGGLTGELNFGVSGDYGNQRHLNRFRSLFTENNGDDDLL